MAALLRDLFGMPVFRTALSIARRGAGISTINAARHNGSRTLWTPSTVANAPAPRSPRSRVTRGTASQRSPDAPQGLLHQPSRAVAADLRRVRPVDRNAM